MANKEVEFMVSQNAIPSKKHPGGSLPYVFTEQGVAAISAHGHELLVKSHRYGIMNGYHRMN